MQSGVLKQTVPIKCESSGYCLCYWNGKAKEQTQEIESRSDLKKFLHRFLGQQRLGIANFKVWGLFFCVLVLGGFLGFVFVGFVLIFFLLLNINGS